MFETLEFQYLNKLVEGKVRDFTTPEAFHRIKVQRLGGDKVKPRAKVSRKFPLKILALVGNLTRQPGQLTDGTPPIVRPFNFARKTFVEFSEFRQGLLQRLRMVLLFTCRKGQIGFHPEVRPYAFTCSGFDFFGGAICHDVEPQRSNSIPTDLNIADSSLPLSMEVIQEIPADKDELPFGFIPFLKGNADGAMSEFVTCLKLRRAVFTTLLELRRTDTPPPLSFFQILKKLFPSKVQPDNYSVKRITRYPRPVLMRALEQLRQVGLQSIPARIFPIDTVIPFLKSEKVVMHIAQVIKHVTDAHILRMFAYLVFFSSHNGSQSHSFNPESVGRQTHYQAVMLILSATVMLLIILHFGRNVKLNQAFGPFQEGGFSSPT